LHNAILKYFDKSIYESKTKEKMQKAKEESDKAKQSMMEKVKKIIGE
jgi:hypothetical protein